MRLRTILLLTAVGALLAATACGTDGSSSETAGRIPAASNILVSIRIGDILADLDLVRLADDLVSPAGAESILDQALDEAAEESGIDLRSLTSLLLFGDIDSDEYFGVFMEGPFDRSEVLSAFEAAEGPLNEDLYRGLQIYTSGAGDTTIYFPEAGKILLGSPPAVRDAIDVQEGVADGLSGSMMDSFNELGDPLIKASFDFPEDILGDEGLIGEVGVPGLDLEMFTGIQSVGVSVDKKRDTFIAAVSLGYPDEASAKQAVEAFDALVTLTDAFSGGGEPTGLLDKIVISASGSSASISYSATIDELRAAIEGLGELSPDLFGGGGLQDFGIPLPIGP
ncbi:MAG: hypothetical protein V3U26_00065 [Dehalococcoidia bacterium]